MTTIELIKCKGKPCFDHKTYDFFCKQKATKFIVQYHFQGNKTILYALLETHIDGAGNGICTMNSQMLYQYGERCLITGYLPIKIKE